MAKVKIVIIVAKIIIIDDDCDNCGKGEDNDNHDACDNCDHFFSLGVLVKLKIFERKHKRLSIFLSYCRVALIVAAWQPG